MRQTASTATAKGDCPGIARCVWRSRERKGQGHQERKGSGRHSGNRHASSGWIRCDMGSASTSAGARRHGKSNKAKVTPESSPDLGFAKQILGFAKQVRVAGHGQDERFALPLDASAIVARSRTATSVGGSGSGSAMGGEVHPELRQPRRSRQYSLARANSLLH